MIKDENRRTLSDSGNSNCGEIDTQNSSNFINEGSITILIEEFCKIYIIPDWALNGVYKFGGDLTVWTLQNDVDDSVFLVIGVSTTLIASA